MPTSVHFVASAGLAVICLSSPLAAQDVAVPRAGFQQLLEAWKEAPVGLAEELEAASESISGLRCHAGPDL